MKKKSIVLMIVLLIMIAAIVCAWIRFSSRWTDINGVTTVSERNTVYMNLKPGTDFYAGSGQLTVDEGKRIHVEYALDSGTFDLAFRVYAKGSDGLDVQSPVFDNLQDSGNVFGKSGVSGKSTLGFDAAPGVYEVYFKSHNAAGSATVTAR